MCKCSMVMQPYVFEVDHDYMDSQYAWLEELIGLAELTDNNPTCDQAMQDIPDCVNKFNE